MALEFEDITGKIIGAAIEVHKTLGPGFLEAIYESALVLDCSIGAWSFTSSSPSRSSIAIHGSANTASTSSSKIKSW